MVYNGKTLQQQSETIGSEYRQANSHSNKNKEVQQVNSQVVTQQFLCRHKNKEVKVTVEFPEQSNPKAEQEFVCRLKEIYLEKVKIGSMQGKKSALSCTPTKDKEEQRNG